jgi:DNA-binding NarL/FixJ family response regulator
VLTLLVSGHTNSELAERMPLSARTVEHHVSGVLAKLGAATRGAAAAHAARLGLAGTAER